MAHVMVVDDDRGTVRLLTILLKMDGFQVSQSPGPKIALEQAKSADAFVIDCHLADFDGLQLLRAIRANNELVGKLVIMTSGKDREQEAMAAGADMFLLKPFSPNKLSASLSELFKEA